MNTEEIQKQITESLTEALKPLKEEIESFIKIDAIKQPKQKPTQTPNDIQQITLSNRLQEVEKELSDLDGSPHSGTNQAQTYSSVGKRVVARTALLNEKSLIEKQLSELMPLTARVEAFINAKPQVSKFDVDEGKASNDNSLTPLSGRSV